MVLAKNAGGVCFLDWNSLASKVSVREDQRNRDNASRSEYVFIRREVTRLYHTLLEMEQTGLIDKYEENAEQAIFAVYCMLGDWILAEYWLSQHRKLINFDFQLFNFCETIEQWLKDLSESTTPCCKSIATQLLQQLTTPRLEGCTILHCAALSGNPTMCRIIIRIWEEVQVKVTHDSRVQQSFERMMQFKPRLGTFYEQIKHDFLTTNTLGFTAYDVVPQCSASNCKCSAAFLSVPCSSLRTRRLLFRRQCNFIPPTIFKEAWNRTNILMVNLDLVKPPIYRLDSTPDAIAALKRRRAIFKLQRVADLVSALVDPTDAEVNLLQNAYNLILRQCEPDMNDSITTDLAGRCLLNLIQHKERNRRKKELEEKRALASTYIATVSELILELKSSIQQGTEAHNLVTRVSSSFGKVSDFLSDSRLSELQEYQKLRLLFGELRKLSKLQEGLRQALSSSDNTAFVAFVQMLKSANMTISHSVQARLEEIDRPRIILQTIQEAVNAPRLAASQLIAALQACEQCRNVPEIASASANINSLLSSLKSLDTAQAHARKCHSQLLAGTSDDTSYVAKFESELAGFHQTCSRIRNSSEPTENYQENAQLVEKWAREQGPSRELKEIMASNDIEAMRRVIEVARQAGVAVKAAKRRLAQLEDEAQARESLQQVLANDSSSVSAIRSAIERARPHAIDVKVAEAHLQTQLQRQECTRELEAAMQQKREERLVTAIDAAKRIGIDITAAQSLLQDIVAKRQKLAQQEQEARQQKVTKVFNELKALLSQPSPSLVLSIEKIIESHTLGSNVAEQAKQMSSRIMKEFERLYVTKDSIKLVEELIHHTKRLQPMNVNIDTSEAQKWLSTQVEASRLRTALRTASAKASESVSEASIRTLQEALSTIQPYDSIPDVVSDIADAKVALDRCRIILELTSLQDAPSPDFPKSLVEFRKYLEAARARFKGQPFDDLWAHLATWEKEDRLVYALRDCIHRKNLSGLTKALQAAREASSAIFLERPRRVAERLQKELDMEVASAKLKSAMEKTFDCSGLVEAIEGAKAAGSSTTEAAALLITWQNHGRSLLATAKTQRNPSVMREVLDETRRMGLMTLLEWKETHKLLTTIESEPLRRDPPVPDRSLDAHAVVHPKFKTEICIHWKAHGDCSYGKDRCNFAHGDDDLIQPNDTRVPREARVRQLSTSSNGPATTKPRMTPKSPESTVVTTSSSNEPISHAKPPPPHPERMEHPSSVPISNSIESFPKPAPVLVSPSSLDHGFTIAPQNYVPSYSEFMGADNTPPRPRGSFGNRSMSPFTTLPPSSFGNGPIGTYANTSLGSYNTSSGGSFASSQSVFSNAPSAFSNVSAFGNGPMHNVHAHGAMQGSSGFQPSMNQGYLNEAYSNRDYMGNYADPYMTPSYNPPMMSMHQQQMYHSNAPEYKVPSQQSWIAPSHFNAMGSSFDSGFQPQAPSWPQQPLDGFGVPFGGLSSSQFGFDASQEQGQEPAENSQLVDTVLNAVYQSINSSSS